MERRGVLEVLQDVPFASGRWSSAAARTLGTVADVELLDGVIELELSVERGRSFHGVIWRVQDDENFESFFVRPHQVGNPDAIQYTPVFNGVSSWQLYHGPGFGAPIAFPIGEAFRIRVAFAGERAEVFVGEPDEPALAIGELKRPAAAGRVGVLAGGPGLHLHRFPHDASGDVAFRAAAPPPAARLDGIVPVWWAATTPTGRATTGSSAASATSTRSTCRSSAARTSCWWPSRRTSAAGASRRDSRTPPVSCSIRRRRPRRRRGCARRAVH
jgi:hypothetical protein